MVHGVWISKFGGIWAGDGIPSCGKYKGTCSGFSSWRREFDYFCGRILCTGGAHESISSFGMNPRGLHLECKRPNRLIDYFVSRRYWAGNSFFSSLSFSAVMIIIIHVGTASSSWSEIIVSENGPVERMSAAMWFMGFVWSFIAAWREKPLRVEWLITTMFFLLFGLRELDAHRWATGWNLDKMANYWNPQFPLGERLLVVGFMVLPCMVVGGIFCSRLWQSIGPAWRTGKPWLSHLALAVTLLIVCVILDKTGPYILPLFGVGMSGQNSLMIIEEFLEMVLAVFALVSVWPYLQKALLGNE